LNPVRGVISGHLIVDLGKLPREFKGILGVKVFFGSGEDQVEHLVDGQVQIQRRQEDNITYDIELIRHVDEMYTEAAWKRYRTKWRQQIVWALSHFWQHSDAANAPQTLWLPDTMIPAGATHLLVFNSNSKGKSSAFSLPLEDIEINPLQLMPNMTFNVTAHTLGRAVAPDVHLVEGDAYDSGSGRARTPS